MKLGRKEIEQEGSEMKLGSLISDIIGHTGCMWLRLSAYLIYFSAFCFILVYGKWTTW